MALAYARVSTFNQGDYGISIDEQVDLIRRYAASIGVRVRQVITEVISGRKNDSFMEVNAAKFKHFMFADVSRFSRSEEAGLDMAGRILRAGIQIHFVRNGLVLSGDMDEANWLEFVRLLRESESESRRIAERVAAVREYKRLRGEHAGGVVPYGLTTIGESKKYAPDDHAIAVIRFIALCRSNDYSSRQLNAAMSEAAGRRCSSIRLYDRQIVDGEYVYEERKHNTEPMYCSDIADLLNEYGIAYKGKPFTGSIVSRIRTEDSLMRLVVEDDELANDFEALAMNEPGVDYQNDPDYAEFLEFRRFKQMMRS